MLRIIAAARHPGPAEAIAATVPGLTARGHQVTLLGVGDHAGSPREHVGSSAIFRRLGCRYTDVSDLGLTGSPIDVRPHSVSELISAYAADRVLVGCASDPSGLHSGIEEALIVAAGQAKVPSIQLVETWDSWFPRRPASDPASYAAADEFTAKVMIARGAPADRIEATGNPAFGALKARSRTTWTYARARVGLGDRDRVIAYFGGAPVTGASPDDVLTFGWLTNHVEPPDRLIFCRHPRDTRHYPSLSSPRARSAQVLELPSTVALDVADVAIAHYSTMLIKAALLGIPSISILLAQDVPDLRAACEGHPLVLAGGATEVNDEESLIAALRAPPTARPHRVRSLLHVDGEAARRVAGLLEDRRGD